MVVTEWFFELRNLIRETICDSTNLSVEEAGDVAESLMSFLDRKGHLVKPYFDRQAQEADQ